MDWLRNAFGQTIVAPYSVRRRPKAPISTPLHWEEVDSKLDPSSFNLLTIKDRLKRKDPWADFWKNRQVLSIGLNSFEPTSMDSDLPKNMYPSLPSA